jgi:hypothetical protein
MKVIVDIKEDQKDLFLALMKENNIHYEVEEDFEIPKWQMEEVSKRINDFQENPRIAVPVDEVMQNLRKRS